MKIKYVKGNLLDCPEKYILHGCNAQGIMGSGVARAIRDKWPAAYKAYKDYEEKYGLAGGSLSHALTQGKIIFNGVTQEFYGKEKKCYVSYAAIGSVLSAIDYYASCCTDESPIGVAMPLIGAGLGGGDWKIISKIIEEESTSFQPVVYHLEELPC